MLWHKEEFAGRQTVNLAASFLWKWKEKEVEQAGLLYTE